MWKIRQALILGLFLLFLVPMINLTSVSSSLMTNISIKILDFKTGGCGGTITNSDAITYWDSRTIVAFTLGIANLDNEPHTLEQVNVTLAGWRSVNYSEFNIQAAIPEGDNLPVTLDPQKYWRGTVSCPPCTNEVSLKLLVDTTVIDFGVISEGLAGFPSTLLTSWTNVVYYTVTLTRTISLELVTVVIGIIVVRVKRI